MRSLALCDTPIPLVFSENNVPGSHYGCYL